MQGIYSSTKIKRHNHYSFRDEEEALPYLSPFAQQIMGVNQHVHTISSNRSNYYGKYETINVTNVIESVRHRKAEI